MPLPPASFYPGTPSRSEESFIASMGSQSQGRYCWLSLLSAVCPTMSVMPTADEPRLSLRLDHRTYGALLDAAKRERRKPGTVARLLLEDALCGPQPPSKDDVVRAPTPPTTSWLTRSGSREAKRDVRPIPKGG